MSVCPKCKNEIKELVREEDSRAINIAYVGQEVNLLVNKETHETKQIGLRYKCPSCKEILFNREPRAQNFLLGPKKRKKKTTFEKIDDNISIVHTGTEDEKQELTPEQIQRQKDVEAFM